MAIKNKSKLKAWAWKFEWSLKSKALLRTLAVSLMLCGIVYLGIMSFEAWRQVWPVNKIVLQSDARFLQQQDLVKFMQQQLVKGMLAIDLQELQVAAKKINWVKNVEIRKVWPDQLIFIIDEHQPVARFDDFILTQQGTQITQQERMEGLMDLPKIELLNNSS